jgi:hypothetical protein
MIHMNLLQEDVKPEITRMPVAEFGAGRVGSIELWIHEIKLSNNLTVVIDEQMAIELCEALLDALPNQADIGGTYTLTDDEDAEDDDKGEEWKKGGKES